MSPVIMPLLAAAWPIIALIVCVFVGSLLVGQLLKGQWFAEKLGGISVSGKFIAQGSIRRRPLMTDAEWTMLNVIEQYYPRCLIMSQVSMDALMEAVSSDRKQFQSIRARFSQKRVDFVVIDRDTRQIVAIIELDDRTHNAHKDTERDAMASMAGYKTIRVPGLKKAHETMLKHMDSRYASM